MLVPTDLVTTALVPAVQNQSNTHTHQVLTTNALVFSLLKGDADLALLHENVAELTERQRIFSK